MYKRTASVLLSALLLLSSGCTASAVSPAPSVSPSITDTVSATSSPPDMDGSGSGALEPEQTDPLGIWIEDDNYGIKSNKNNYQFTYSIPSHKTIELKSKEDYDYYKQFYEEITIEQWTYYLDVEHPIEYIDEQYDDFDFDFPVYRKNSSGTIEFINMYGMNLQASNKYLYVGSLILSGTDFVAPYTWRVSLDLSEVEYVGNLWDILLSSRYIYFHSPDSNGLQLYRTSNEFETVERLTVSIPDWDAIMKKTEIDPEYGMYNINIDKIDLQWIYYSFGVMDDNYSDRYVGHYKIKLSGGKSYKTDKGKYYRPETEENID